MSEDKNRTQNWGEYSRFGKEQIDLGMFHLGVFHFSRSDSHGAHSFG